LEKGKGTREHLNLGTRKGRIENSSEEKSFLGTDSGNLEGGVLLLRWEIRGGKVPNALAKARGGEKKGFYYREKGKIENVAN